MKTTIDKRNLMHSDYLLERKRIDAEYMAEENKIKTKYFALKNKLYTEYVDKSSPFKKGEIVHGFYNRASGKTEYFMGKITGISYDTYYNTLSYSVCKLNNSNYVFTVSFPYIWRFPEVDDEFVDILDEYLKRMTDNSKEIISICNRRIKKNKKALNSIDKIKSKMKSQIDMFSFLNKTEANTLMKLQSM